MPEIDTPASSPETPTEIVVPRARIDLPALQSRYDGAVSDIVSRLGAPSSPSMRVTNRKTFIMPDGTERSGPLPFVVVDFVYENRWYSTPYNANNPTPPDCAAINAKSADLMPFEDGIDVQHDGPCNKCPKDVWGSAPTGRGKACTNAILLALLDPLAPPNSPLLRLRTSPTAITPFETYVRTLSKVLNKPLWAVLTYIGFDPNSDYATLRFGNPKALEDDSEFELADQMVHGPTLIHEAVSRAGEAREMLLTKPDFTIIETPAKPQARAGGSRRAAA